MTTPVETSPFERLQSTIMQFHNRKVNTQFADINSSNATTQRALLKSDLLIKDTDTAMMMLLRMTAFTAYIDDEKYYGIPIEEYHRTVVFRPQVCLRFIESRAAAKTAKRQRVRMEISFRLLTKDSETITRTDITELTREINTSFPRSYSFDKGKDKYSYRDLQNGHRFIIAGQTETEVKDLITRTLRVIDKTPDWDYLTCSKVTDRNLTSAKYQTILTERKKLPQYRPNAKVYLQRAELKIHGNLEDVLLVDRAVA
jgi:hypothetical protein